MNGNKRFHDELLNKKNHLILGKGLDLFSFCICISILFKLVKVSNILSDYYVEMAAVLISGGYVLGKLFARGLLFQKDLDPYMVELKNKYKARGFMIGLITMLTGNLLYLYISQNMSVTFLYIPVWFVPVFVCCIKIMKQGTLITGTEKNKNRTLGNLKIRTFIASIIFGLGLCGGDIYYDKAFHLSGILWTLYATIAFGAIFYFVFKLILDVNDKKQSIDRP